MLQKRNVTRKFVTVSLLSMLLLALSLTAASTLSKPEEVGLSSERLHRIHQTIWQHMEAGDFAGAVTMVARKGRLAYFEAQGLMDIESKKPMSKRLPAESR